MRMNRKHGRDAAFTLIELLVVVAIILIIAAIAIPSYMHAKVTASQTASVGNLKTIYTAENQFQDEWGSGFQPLNALADAAASSTTPATCVVPNLLPAATLGTATPVMQGYSYAFKAAGNPVTLSSAQTTEGCVAGTTDFNVSATAQDPNSRGYFLDSTGLIRYCIPTSETAACVATATSPVVGQ